MKQIDLNADLGEGFAFDQALLAVVSSANVACGAHAGGEAEMRQAVQTARKNGVRIGAHPGYPDPENFGRVVMPMPLDELDWHLHFQLNSLQQICQEEGVEIAYVKPHGALYNLAAKDESVAELIADCVYQFNPTLKLMGLAGSLMLNVAEKRGLGTISEVFADRHYLPDGSLVPRTQPNALVANDDEALKQVLEIVQTGKVTAIDGSQISLKAESICLHGDNEHALQFAERIRRELERQQFCVRA